MARELCATMTRQYAEVIAPHRRRRTAETVAALRGLDSAFDPELAKLPDGLISGLLSHTLYTCIHAHSAGDALLARAALDTWLTPLAHSPASWTGYEGRRWLILNRERCLSRPAIDRRFDTPCYLACGDAVAVGFDRLPAEFWGECWKLLDLTDLLFFATTATEIIIHLQYRDMADSLTGYSLFPLVGTVFTDWTDSPLRHAESIVHEAAHSYLNMLLDASGSVADGGVTYWSPWRAMQRPAMGIVHGAWAFSIVHALYYRLWLGSGFGVLGGQQLRYCRDRSDYELTRLEVVRPYLADALTQVGNPHVTDLVLAWFPVGRSLPTPA